MKIRNFGVPEEDTYILLINKYTNKVKNKITDILKKEKDKSEEDSVNFVKNIFSLGYKREKDIKKEIKDHFDRDKSIEECAKYIINKYYIITKINKYQNKTDYQTNRELSGEGEITEVTEKKKMQTNENKYNRYIYHNLASFSEFIHNEGLINRKNINNKSSKLNEGLRDKMRGYTDDEVRDKLKNLDIDTKLYNAIIYNILDVVKDTFESLDIKSKKKLLNKILYGLVLAAGEGHKDILNYFIDNNFITIKSHWNNVIIVCAEKDMHDIIKRLVDKRMGTISGLKYALTLAVQNNNTKSVEELLKHRQLNPFDKNKTEFKTPFEKVINQYKGGRLDDDILKLFFNHDLIYDYYTNDEIKDLKKSLSLNEGIRDMMKPKSKEDIIKVLDEETKDMDQEDLNELFLQKVNDFDMEYIDYLIDKGIDINYQSRRYGDTALHLAISWESEELVDLLLSLGADPRITNADGKSPIYLASSINRDIYDMLIRYEENMI